MLVKQKCAKQYQNCGAVVAHVVQHKVHLEEFFDILGDT